MFRMKRRQRTCSDDCFAIGVDGLCTRSCAVIVNSRLMATSCIVTWKYYVDAWVTFWSFHLGFTHYFSVNNSLLFDLFSKFIIKTINKFIFQSGIQSMTSTPNNNSWETLKEKYMIKYIEYVYRSEDKLYQVLYDRKNRPEIYKLKKQQFEQNSITRYNELSMK